MAQVVIDWNQEREQNMLPIESIRENAKFLTQSITESLTEAVQGKTQIKVNEQYCDFWEVEDE